MGPACVDIGDLSAVACPETIAEMLGESDLPRVTMGMESGYWNASRFRSPRHSSRGWPNELRAKKENL